MKDHGLRDQISRAAGDNTKYAVKANFSTSKNFSALAISHLPLALYPLPLNNFIRYLQQTNNKLTIN